MSRDDRSPRGLGDLPSRLDEERAYHWDLQESGQPVAREKRVYDPKKGKPSPRPIPGLESIQALIKDDLIPRLQWVLCNDLRRCMNRDIWNIKNENWDRPPITGRCMDMFTNAGVTITNAGVSVLVSDTVSDRSVGVVKGFGNALESQSAWGDASFGIFKNNAGIMCYEDIRIQLGDISSPTEFPMPVILKWGDEVKVTATSLSVANHVAFCRLTGYTFPVKHATEESLYGSWLTL